MVFGRNKKDKDRKQKSDEEEALNDLNMDEQSSTGGNSVPPPPPDAVSKSELYRDEPSDTPQDNEQRGKDEEQDVGVSFLTDPTVDSADADKDGKADQNRRKKYLLLFSCIALLAILIGLSVKYARNQPQTNPSTSSNGESSSGNFFDTGEEAVPVDNGGGGTLTGVPEDTTDLSPGNNSTLAPTDNGSEEGSSSLNDPESPGDMQCVFDQVFTSSSCQDGVTTVTITMCVVGPIDDQFWTWIETPAPFQSFAQDDWGFLSDEMNVQWTGLPPGSYEIGLYDNGNEDLDEYPLITSSTFTVGVC